MSARSAPAAFRCASLAASTARTPGAATRPGPSGPAGRTNHIGGPVDVAHAGRAASAIALVAYVATGLGVSVGLHRYLTHGAFTAPRWLRVTLALAGGLAVEGSPTQWVADHRRHHQFSDREGDPHSPWRYGANVRGLA